MVDRIEESGSLAREAIRAAMRAQQERAAEIQSRAAALGGPSEAPPAAAGFTRALEDGVAALDQRARGAQELPQDLVTGKVTDFHEIAVQIKDAELSFRFALEIRNKLIDAYREVMRMSV